MAKLIEKENVDLYGGDIVFLETHTGAGLVEIHEELCRLKQQHSMVRKYVFWFDRDEEGG